MRYLRELWRLSVVFNFTLTARLYHHTGNSLANHEPIYARRSQPRLLPPAAAGSGISAVYEDDISSTLPALPTVLSTSKLQGTSSGAGDHSTIYRLPLLDRVATDYSISPVCNSHAACSAWSGHRHNNGTPSSLRTAWGHEWGHLTPTPDEAHDSLAIKAHIAPAEFSDARRPPVLGSCPPHVLLSPSSQQCAGYVQHGTGSTCLAQGRRESRRQAGELTIRSSKTARSTQVPQLIVIPARPGHRLCLGALLVARELAPDGPDTRPFFSWPSGKAYCHRHFMTCLRQLMGTLAEPPKEYGCHSFRRGGATHAFRNGARSESIQHLGNWRSEAYTRYLCTPAGARDVTHTVVYNT
jgi:hypothetical protein